MTTTSHDLFVTGLANAHAMENQALSIMKPQASRIENYLERLTWPIGSMGTLKP